MESDAGGAEEVAVGVDGGLGGHYEGRGLGGGSEDHFRGVWGVEEQCRGKGLVKR